jgi:hypothetical protein
MQVPYTDNRVIVQEFEIRKSVAEKILRDNGFDNKTTCIEAWKAADVLDYEDKHHPTRRRKIDVLAAKGSAEDVYVFRVFADKESVEEIMEEIRKRMEDEAKRQKKILKNKAKILELLHEKEDEDDGWGQKGAFQGFVFLPLDLCIDPHRQDQAPDQLQQENKE